MKKISNPKFIEKLYNDVHTCPSCGTKFQLEENIDILDISSKTADEVSELSCFDADCVHELIKGNTDCFAVELTDDNKKSLVEDMQIIHKNFQDGEGFNIYFPNENVTYLTCKFKCPTCGKEIIKNTTIYSGNILAGCYKVSYREADCADIAYGKFYGYIFSAIALGEVNQKDIDLLEKLNYTKLDGLTTQIFRPLTSFFKH
jgi:predicted RNA-binding Zn-ribbon protein involved in translation (DUF1610 family)